MISYVHSGGDCKDPKRIAGMLSVLKMQVNQNGERGGEGRKPAKWRFSHWQTEEPTQNKKKIASGICRDCHYHRVFSKNGKTFHKCANYEMNNTMRKTAHLFMCKKKYPGLQCKFYLRVQARLTLRLTKETAKIFLLASLAASASPLFAQYTTLGANSCGLGQANCHTQENDWWSADPHITTHDRFYNSAKSVNIAKAYGLALDAARRTDSICMSCHGTMISAAPTAEPEYGVSCESCHGPGSGYKEPHSSEKGKGYEIGVRNGMRRNKDMAVRAQMCVQCHFIANGKLINAGHPDGKNFDYEKGLRQVAKHFRTPDTPPERTAFMAAVGAAKRNPGMPVVIAAAPITPEPKKALAPKPEIAASAKPDTNTRAKTESGNMAFEKPAPIAPPVEKTFLPAPLPIPPRGEHKRPLDLPPFPEDELKRAKTTADSIAIMVQHLNTLLRLTRP